jgi:hypothetical protein
MSYGQRYLHRDSSGRFLSVCEGMIGRLISLFSILAFGLGHRKDLRDRRSLIVVVVVGFLVLVLIGSGSS